jgi:hypothetical protein
VRFRTVSKKCDTIGVEKGPLAEPRPRPHRRGLLKVAPEPKACPLIATEGQISIGVRPGSGARACDRVR